MTFGQRLEVIRVAGKRLDHRLGFPDRRYDASTMTRRHRDDSEALDALLEEILIDAYGDDEQLTAFQTTFEDQVALPADAFVIGERIFVIGIDYDGNQRRGLTATVSRLPPSGGTRRRGGGDYVVSLPDVRFSPDSEGARYVAAYRKWLGLEPLPDSGASASRRSKRQPATDDDLILSDTVELVVLAVKKTVARCRLPGTDRQITLRAQVWRLVPGEIATVKPRKQWRRSGHPYLSGKIEASRLDVPALGLTPLGMRQTDTWDPSEEYWGEEGDPLEECLRPIIAFGPRPEFKMEQILPGLDPADPFWDPLLEASEMNAAGDSEGARKLLMELLIDDLRCLDAHAHLGNFEFDHRAAEAIRHYEAGVRIGELSFSADFSGVLRWGFIDNRPFLRCLHGYGLCLWQLGRLEEAAKILERLLWLNPADNQGVRFLIGPVREGEKWEQSNGE